ncbi:MAG: type VII secretion protein EssC [Bacilli bacterium]
MSKTKITQFDLPEKAEESFLIPYIYDDSITESLITIEAVNNIWELKSNGSVNITDNNQTIWSIELKEYNYYNLTFLGHEEPILLYALPIVDEVTYKLDFKQATEITIGRSEDCHITYNNNLTAPIQAALVKKEANWYLVSKDEAHTIYLNNNAVKESILHIGDIIFINGLRIIWMNYFIKLNNPNKCISVNGFDLYNEPAEYDITKYNAVSDNDSCINLYKDSDYFYHVPRLTNTLTEENIVIDAPPKGDLAEELPFILSIGSSITMAASSLMTGYTVIYGLSTGTKTLMSALPALVMTVAMIIGCLILPRVTSSYQKNRKKKHEKLRQEKYREYLKQKATTIEGIIKKQEQILNNNNPSIRECYDMINNQSSNINFWSREVTDRDFLNIRLGMGSKSANINIQAPEEHFTLEEDNLVKEVYQVVNHSKELNNVPITVSLSEMTSFGFFAECSYKNNYIDGLILQLIALQSANDLKIVVLTSKENEKRWEYIKYLPHCWSKDKATRFLATTPEEINELSSYLDHEYKTRKEMLKTNSSATEEVKKEAGYKNFAPYYVIINDDYKATKGTVIIDDILKDNYNYGFSFLCFANNMRDLPNKCSTFIEIGEKTGRILGTEINNLEHNKFSNEYSLELDMRHISNVLANIPLMTTDGLSVLPTMLSFLEMYNVSKIEQLNILNRWKNNNPVVSLSVPVGIHTNGEQFKLDLHEKFHGPHGLIAGSTGSGKSEFIITFILSMAANYHPYEAQFVLIDYKGGGLAGAFENKETGVRIPHLIGTITNLDTSEMNRTLVSIESEMKRRQRQFNEVRDQLGESTIDIYKYQKLYREGVVKEPMAHLFIISDEFAELKSQQPEFMQQLISTARIGRSLGIHLILATQKPTGVVNDQIWSNSKFKICMKVQDRSDSMEMLKRPEAASIKETGRFYLQVGYNDYFDIGQSGWCGARYIPTDVVLRKEDDSISFVNNIGYVTKSINDLVKKDKTNELGDQLTNIVKYISNIASKENLKTKKLWLDAIPSEIYITDLKKKYNYKSVPYHINPVIGEYDEPAAQKQGLLNLDLNHDGNTLIYGQSGSGKENLLSTIIFSCIIENTPAEVNFYIIDLGAETLKMFYKMPHVGEVITIDEDNKIFELFGMIDDELERRKNLFADYGGNYNSYCENSGNKEPLIIIVINNYESFSETYVKYAEGIQGFIRDGAKYGVVFIITVSSTSTVRSRMAQSFNHKITLQLAADSDYRTLLNAPRDLFPAKFFGRGLIEHNDRVVEFQTAYIYKPKEINSVIRSVAEQCNKAYTTRAKKIPTVPEIVTFTDIKDEIDSITNLPIGYDINTKKVYGYNFIQNRFTTILSNDITKNTSFLTVLLEEFKQLANTQVKVIDFISLMANKDFENNFYNSDDQGMVNLNNEIMASNETGTNNIYLFLGIGNLRNKLSPIGLQVCNNIFNSAEKLNNCYFIFADSYINYKRLQLESWYQSQVDTSNGIWLDEGSWGQMAINITNMTMDERKISYPYMGLVVHHGEHVFIKYVVEAEVNKDEE